MLSVTQPGYDGQDRAHELARGPSLDPGSVSILDLAPTVDGKSSSLSLLALFTRSI
jgi:hypothetical protein